MKKMILVLAVLLMTAPAMAGIVVSAADVGGGEVTISYEANGVEMIRAFALNIEVDSGATIEAIGGLNTQYNIYPGSIIIVGDEVNDVGTPVADAAAYPGTGTLGGLGTAGITIEMGSLEVSGDATGALCTLTVVGDCNVAMTENAARGGAVMEDTGIAADATLKGCAFIDPGPACWSNPCQAIGDADESGMVNYADLYLLRDSLWTMPGNPLYNPCADFDRNEFINYNDLYILRDNLWSTCP